MRYECTDDISDDNRKTDPFPTKDLLEDGHAEEPGNNESPPEGGGHDDHAQGAHEEDGENEEKTPL